MEKEETLWPIEKWGDELIILRIEKLLFSYTGILRLSHDDSSIGDDRNSYRMLLDIPRRWRTYGRLRGM
jgi:hypothetical protein